MSLDDLKKVTKVIGLKQVTKVINRDQAAWVFLGADADDKVVGALKSLCEEKRIAIETAYTMAELGKACNISVGAAAVAVLK